MASAPLAISIKQACNRYPATETELVDLVFKKKIHGFLLRRRIMIVRLTADDYFANIGRDAQSASQYSFDFETAAVAA